jgi:hypothetical protein
MSSKSGNVAADHTPETVTDVAVSRGNGGSSVIERMAMLNAGTGIVSTLDGATREGKVATLNAVTNAEPINEHLGEVINLTHVVVQAVQIADEKTGEVSDVPRTILLTDDGTAYAAVSDAILGSLRDVFGIMGHPSEWTEPLPVKVVEKRGRAGFRFYKIELA